MTISSMAFAQEAAPQAADNADIVVTASRKAGNVQRSALSIQAFFAEVLVRANVTEQKT